MYFESLGGYLLFIGRTLAGFISACLLAFIGDLTGRVVNLLLGYPWSQDVHVNLQLGFIGVGAGIGAYLGWMNLNMNRYLSLGTLALIVAVAVIGVYLGRAFGPGVDPTYWWSRFATDISVLLGAAAGGTVTATLIRLIDQLISLRQHSAGPRRYAMTTRSPTITSSRD